MLTALMMSTLLWLPPLTSESCPFTGKTAADLCSQLLWLRLTLVSECKGLEDTALQLTHVRMMSKTRVPGWESRT